MERNIRIERILPYSCEQVWHALTDQRILASWFMPNDIKPELHYEFTFHMKPQRGWDGMTYCEVIELEPLHRLAYSYHGRASGEKTLACARIDSPYANAAVKNVFTELDTVLRFTLTPERLCDGAEKTRLVLEHTGFKGLKLMLVSIVMESGWRRRVLRRLSEVLDSLDPATTTEESITVGQTA